MELSWEPLPSCCERERKVLPGKPEDAGARGSALNRDAPLRHVCALGPVSVDMIGSGTLHFNVTL